MDSLLPPEFNSLNDLDKLKYVLTKVNWSSFNKDQWEFINSVTEDISHQYIKPPHLVSILINPNLSYENKYKRLHKTKALKNLWRNLNSNQYPQFWINEPAFEFLCTYFQNQSWTHCGRIDNVSHHLIKPRQDWDYFQTNAYYFALLLKYFPDKSKIKTEESAYDYFLQISAITDFDLTSVFTNQQIKSFNKKTHQEIIKAIKQGRLPNREHFPYYLAHCKEIDKEFKTAKAPLELFSPLFANTTLKNWSMTAIEVSNNMPNLPVKEWIQEEFGNKSSNLINFLSNDIKCLENFIHFRRVFQIIEDLIGKDWNLIWQLLETGNHTSYQDIYSYLSNLEPSVRQLLTPSQWVVILTEFFLNPKNHDLYDISKMVYQCQKPDGTNPLVAKLHELCRFNDYNTIEKLHEKVIILYNQASQKEYPLKIEEWFPELKDKLLSLPKLEVVIPQTNTDMIIWGQRLNICVGSYAQDVKNQQTLVLGVKELGQIKYCVEFNLQGHLVQFKGKHNESAPENLRTLACAWVKELSPSFLKLHEDKKNRLKIQWLQEIQTANKSLEFTFESMPLINKIFNCIYSLVDKNPVTHVELRTIEQSRRHLEYFMQQINYFKDSFVKDKNYRIGIVYHLGHYLNFLYHELHVPPDMEESVELLLNEFEGFLNSLEPRFGGRRLLGAF